MAISTNSHNLALIETEYLLKKYRFGFEKARIAIEYFPIDDKYFLGAKGIYQLQFDLGYSLKLDNKLEFYQKIGLIPVWSDPIC